MAQLLVRQLEESLVKLLKQRAAEHGCSAEEEHRRILREALVGIPTDSEKPSLKAYLIAEPYVEEDWLPERSHSSERQIDF